MKRIQLAKVCELITDGTHYTPPDVGNGFPFLTVKDMTPQGLDFLGCSRISPEEFYAASQQNSAPISGDVLFSKDGTVGKVHVVTEEQPFAVLSSIAIIRPNQKLIEPRFLSHLLRSPALLIQTEQRKTGSALRRIILKDIRQLEIPLPPLQEQERIAAILDQADSLRRLRRRALDRLNTLGQAIFHEMFGDPVLNERSWRREPAGSICERISVGVVIKPASYYVDEGVPALRGTNIKPHGIDDSDLVFFSNEAHAGPLRKSQLKAGDLISVRSGRPGLTAVVPEKFDGANAIDVLISTPNRNRINATYLRDFLNSAGGRKIVMSEARGQVQQHFNVKSLSEAQIPVPPLQLQNAYGHRLEVLEGEIGRMCASLSLQETAFTSLQHRAFRGEL